MGDFQDIFGTNADIEAIIEAYADRPGDDHEDPPPTPAPHRYWFATFDAAAAILSENRDRTLTIYPHLGGYQVEAAEQLLNRGEIMTNARPDHECRIVALEQELPSAGDRPAGPLRLADGGAASHVLYQCVESLPIGRCTVFPIRMTLSELEVVLNAASHGLCHALDLEGGGALIAADDHSALIGRRTREGNIVIYPWGFDISHPHANADPYAASDQCFVCRTRELEQVPDDQVEWERWGDRRRFDLASSAVPNTAFAAPTNGDLARSVAAWRAILAPVCAQMSSTVLPSYQARPVFRGQAAWVAIRDQCALLAAARAASGDFSRSIRVMAIPHHSDGSGFEIGVHVGEIQRCKVLPGSRSLTGRSVPLPPVEALDPAFPGGPWSRCVVDGKLDAAGEPRGRISSEVEVTYEVENLSAHQKIAALEILSKIRAQPKGSPGLARLLE